MATLVVFDVTKRKRYVFKKHPFKSMLDDLEGAFSRTLMGVMHIDDIRAYIYCKKEPIGLDRIRSHIETMMNPNMSFKDEFTHFTNHPIIEYVTAYEFYELEWIKILLSRIHDDLFWIGEVLVHITSDLIYEITELSKTGAILPTGKDVRKQVEKACRSRSDKHGMTIEPIEESKDIKLIAMILGYKFQHANRVTSVFVETILVAIRIIRKNGDFNLCEILCTQLLDNMLEPSSMTKEKCLDLGH